jgi:hypothetical protein
MKILGLKSKIRLDNYTATITDITTKGLTLLKDRGDSIEITFAEAEKFLQNKQMEVLEI